MANSESPGNRPNEAGKGTKKEDRDARSARALRENLKKRKQQLKARETPRE